MIRQIENGILIRDTNVFQPFLRNSVPQQLRIGQGGEDFLLRYLLCRNWRVHVARDENLLNALTDLDQLRRTGFGMRLQLAPLRPFVGVIVMADIAKEQAVLRLVNDQSDVAANAG